MDACSTGASGVWLVVFVCAEGRHGRGVDLLGAGQVREGGRPLGLERHGDRNLRTSHHDDPHDHDDHDVYDDIDVYDYDGAGRNNGYYDDGAGRDHHYDIDVYDYDCWCCVGSG